MDTLHYIALVLVTWTDEMGKDVWHWVLANFNMVAIVGAFRMWSMAEHRKTARALEAQRAELAAQIAATAKQATKRATSDPCRAGCGDSGEHRYLDAGVSRGKQRQP